MKKIEFTKMVASGNDFVIAESLQLKAYSLKLRNLAKKVCDRKFGIGADGLLILERSKRADMRMRIFNADGSEAEMCGNGARCTALYAKRYTLNAKPRITIETKAGIIAAQVKGNNVRIKLTDPTKPKLNIPIKVLGRNLKVNFINTGVPHSVIFVEGLEAIHVERIGRQIRNHPRFAPGGTNVDFVEVLAKDLIAVRTYERGVEDETLACGTGAVAAALITAYSLQLTAYNRIYVQTKSGEVLKVYFERSADQFKNVWLEGKPKVVYTGVYDV